MEYEVKGQIRKASNTAFLMVIIYIGFQFAAAFITGIIKAVQVAVTGDMTINEQTVNLLLIMAYLILYPIGVPLIWIIFKHTKIGKLKPDFKGLIQKPKIKAGKIFKWILIFLSLTYLSSIVANFLFTLIEMLTGFSPTSLTMIPSDNTFSRASVSVVIIIFAPIFEEIMFRGMFYNSCEHLGGWSMVLAGGIIFGLFHMNYSQIIYAAVLGTGACFLYKKTRSIIPGIILHLSLNILGGLSSLAVSFVDQDSIKALMNGEQQAMEAADVMTAPLIAIGCIEIIIFSVIIAGTILFIIELVKHRDSFKLYKGSTDISEKKKFAVFFTSPLAVICVLLMFAVTVVNALGIL